MLRWTAPVKNMARTVTADTEFHGTQLREGEKMILLFESANFDEKVFDDPERFDITRYPNNHLAFGFGTHFCLGNQLARLEISLMQERLLKRLPDMRLASDAELPLRPANFVSGLESMPVTFTPPNPSTSSFRVSRGLTFGRVSVSAADTPSQSRSLRTLVVTIRDESGIK